MPYSYQREVSDGVRTLYPVNFDFVNKEDVYVYVGADDTYAQQVQYQWADDTTVELLNPAVELPNGTAFTVRRVTDREVLLHLFANKSIYGKAIDEVHLQILHVSQEISDGFWTIDAEWLAIQNLNMAGYTITNMGNAKAAQDAVTLVQAMSLLAGVPTAPADSVATLLVYANQLESDNKTLLASSIPNLEEFGVSTVYVQGVRQTLSDSYIVYPDRILFSEELVDNEVITIITGVDPEVAPVYTSKMRMGHIASEGQVTFLAPDYVIGNSELLVSVAGVIQHITRQAYTEVDGRFIEFSEGLWAGAEVEILRIQ